MSGPPKLESLQQLWKQIKAMHVSGRRSRRVTTRLKERTDKVPIARRVAGRLFCD